MTKFRLTIYNPKYLKYEIIKKLGSGAFGDVYKGLNRETNVNVAIKIDKLEVKKQLAPVAQTP